MSQAGQEAATGEICKAVFVCYFTDEVDRARFRKRQSDKQLRIQDIIDLKKKGVIATVINIFKMNKGNLPEGMLKEKGDALTRIFEEGWIEDYQWDKFLLGPVEDNLVESKHVSTSRLEEINLLIRSSVSRDRKRRPTLQDLETYLKDTEVFTVRLDHDRDVFLPSQPSQGSQPQTNSRDPRIKSPLYIDV